MNILNSSNNNLDEIVFENRNKSYGAYALRKDAAKYTNLGMVYGLSPFVLLGLWAFIFSQKKSKITTNTLAFAKTDVTHMIKDVAIQLNNILIIPDLANQKLNSELIDYNKIVKDESKNKIIKRSIEVNQIESQNFSRSSNILKGFTGNNSLVGKADDVIGKAVDFPTIVPKVKPFDIVEIMPEYPGGMQAMYDYITSNLQYPKIAKENNKTGKVVLSFVVMANGGIGDINVIQGIGFGCDDEAKRVISEMPNWIPGIQNGTHVSVRLLLPINFTQE